MGADRRPEHTNPPEIYYGDDEARKYTGNSHVIDVQTRLARRSLELLALPPDEGPMTILDLGCGSGLSGEVISEAGHHWVGCDIAPAMLDVAREREVAGDLMLHDMGDGLPFRSGTFDGAISISAVQWLCNADTSSANPRRRIRRFFESLYRVLNRGARAALQIYPETTEQAEMLAAAAMRAGFSGGLVVDFPHSTRAKKYFLVLMVGPSTYQPQARGLDGEEEDEEVDAEGLEVYGRRGGKRRKVGGGVAKKDKGWIVKKKEQMRKKGYENVPVSNKFTGRKRKARF
ncbi:unnamed protein product [Pedinophyceae sp. YPF-701]|nr:unnamed protein product [Pedinophyceae sp. YPF-701]